MKKALACFLTLFAVPSLATAANPIVENIWGRAKVIVYDLPEADGRAEAIQYVEAMRDRFKPKVEILDAAANQGALKDKLKNGFILYTTLGEKSELLRRATAKLGMGFAGGTFHWREITAPAGEVRLIVVGANPYSRGYCVIFAAGSNRRLVGIHDTRHGTASYHVFQGERLIREGIYDQNFVSVERLSKTAALEDVNQLFNTMRRVHPNLLGRVSEADYRKLKQQTVDGVVAKLDAKGEIAMEDFAPLLYYAAASLKDGHTWVYWPTSLNELNTRGKRFPAFRLHFDNGRFVIAAAKDAALQESEIVEVNGAPVAEFLRPILDRCSGETLGYRVARFLSDEAYWYHLTNLFRDDAPYVLKLRDAKGQSRQATLETLNYAEYRDFMDNGGGVKFHPNREGTKVEFLDSGATAHLLYSSFDSSAAEKKKIDGIFREVKTKGTHNLILDIRGNGGGQSDIGEYIFHYLYGGKFRTFRMVRAKTSWDILHQVPWWARPIIFVTRGHVLSHSIGEDMPRKPDAFFTGHVYLLTDNGSFSMATAFATMFRDYEVGTILGYETGGTPHMFGGPHHFTLKNSRVPCAVAWTENLPARQWPGDDDHGVIPNVPLSDEKLADFKAEQDPVLAYTLRYIKTTAQR